MTIASAGNTLGGTCVSSGSVESPNDSSRSWLACVLGTYLLLRYEWRASLHISPISCMSVCSFLKMSIRFLSLSFSVVCKKGKDKESQTT